MKSLMRAVFLFWLQRYDLYLLSLVDIVDRGAGFAAIAHQHRGGSNAEKCAAKSASGGSECSFCWWRLA